MLKKIILLAIFFHIANFSFSQSEELKEEIYQYINGDSQGSGKIIPKIDYIENKELLFKEAEVFPVYKIKFDRKKEASLEQNTNSFLVFYKKRMYVFFNGDKSRLFETSPLIKNISDYISNGVEFNIVYLNDAFSVYGYFLAPLIMNKQNNLVIDGKSNQSKPESLDSYIKSKYGTYDKYIEKVKLDEFRKELFSKDVDSLISNNYHFYETYCPKDTTLILNTFINQIKIAVKDISKSQESQLRKRLNIKINPYDYYLKGKITDSIINELKEKNTEYHKNKLKIQGEYDFMLYGENITNELLSVLTEKQFLLYKNYIDTVYPLIETNTTNPLNSKRFHFTHYLLVKKKIIRENSFGDYNSYVKNILSKCGCL